MAMHLRPPSTSRSHESMASEDLKWYRYFDRQGKKLSGYPWAGDVYHDYRTIFPLHVITGEPTKPIPLFGHGPDFGYFYFGSVWYNDELWNVGRMKDLQRRRPSRQLRRPGLERSRTGRKSLPSLENPPPPPTG